MVGQEAGPNGNEQSNRPPAPCAVLRARLLRREGISTHIDRDWEASGHQTQYRLRTRQELNREGPHEAHRENISDLNNYRPGGAELVTELQTTVADLLDQWRREHELGASEETLRAWAAWHLDWLAQRVQERGLIP